jgi:hypothetical protein
MIRWSVTDRSISTGLAADPAIWETRSIGLNRTVWPAFKQVDAWTKADGSSADVPALTTIPP